MYLNSLQYVYLILLIPSYCTEVHKNRVKSVKYNKFWYNPRPQNFPTPVPSSPVPRPLFPRPPPHLPPSPAPLPPSPASFIPVSPAPTPRPPSHVWIFGRFSNIKNNYFDGLIRQMYSSELQLNKANSSETETRFWICLCLFYKGSFHAKFMINAMILILRL